MSVDSGLANLVQMTADEMRENEPAVGTVDIGKATAPWTARQMTTEANVGPKSLMGNLVEAVSAMFQMRLDWHARNPDEAMVAFPRGESSEMYKFGRKNRQKVVKVEPSKVDMDEFSIEAAVNPISSAEQLTTLQMMKELFQPGAGLMPLITESEFYRTGMNKADPEDYAIQVRVENLAKPYIDGYTKLKVTEKMGTKFVMGVDGELLGMDGTQMPPGSAAERAGWQRAVPPAATTMPSLPPLTGVNGAEPIAGLV
jgi:hypothetical protein